MMPPAPLQESGVAAEVVVELAEPEAEPLLDEGFVQLEVSGLTGHSFTTWPGRRERGP